MDKDRTPTISTIPDSTSAQIGPRTPGDVYVTAARAEHNTHCTRCRENAAAIEAAAAENGASMRRRDRRQLGLRPTHDTVVTV